jgi:hypothetical protein
MSSGMTDLFSREELLAACPRRASMALFTLKRGPHILPRAQQAMYALSPRKRSKSKSALFLDAIKRKRDLPSAPSIQDLERFAPD